MATNYVLQHSGKEIDTLLEKVQNLPEDISTLKFSIVNELPTEGIDLSTIYLVKTANEDYEEYIYINNNWEMLGTTKVDLTDYVTKNELSFDIIQYNNQLSIPRYAKEVFDNWKFIRTDKDSTEIEVDLVDVLEEIYNLGDELLRNKKIGQASEFTFKPISYTDSEGNVYSSLVDLNKIMTYGTYFSYKDMKMMIGGSSGPVMLQVYCFKNAMSGIILLLGPTNAITASSYNVEYNYVRVNENVGEKIISGEQYHVDLNEFKEPGVYVLKNVNGTTASNIPGDLDFGESIFFDIVLTVTQRYTSDGTKWIWQDISYGNPGNTYFELRRTFDTAGWSEWHEIKTEAYMISKGTFTSGMSCATPTGDNHLVNKKYVDTTAMPASAIVNAFWTGTQAEYDALTGKSTTTLYLIQED